MDQELFTKVTGVTRKYDDIVKDFQDAYGDEATEKLQARIKAWVGEGKVFDFDIDEKYPLSKAQELLDAAGVDYDLSEADVETGSSNDDEPTGGNTNSYDDHDGSDDDNGSNSD